LKAKEKTIARSSISIGSFERKRWWLFRGNIFIAILFVLPSFKVDQFFLYIKLNE